MRCVFLHLSAWFCIAFVIVVVCVIYQNRHTLHTPSHTHTLHSLLGDPRWAGRWGVDACFVALEHCQLLVLQTKVRVSLSVYLCVQVIYPATGAADQGVFVCARVMYILFISPVVCVQNVTGPDVDICFNRLLLSTSMMFYLCVVSAKCSSFYVYVSHWLCEHKRVRLRDCVPHYITLPARQGANARTLLRRC